MRKADIFVAILLMAVGALVVADSVRLGFGWGRNGPESGFFPFYLGAGLILCMTIVLLNNLIGRKKGYPGARLILEGGLTPILWVLIPATAMILLTGLIGLHVAATIYLLFYMRVVGKIDWVKTVLVSLFVPIILYIAFDKLFMVPLPQGVWGGKLIPF